MNLEDLSSFLVSEFSGVSQTNIIDALKEALMDFNQTPPQTDFAEDNIPDNITSALLAGARYFVALKQANYYAEQPDISAQTPYVSRANLTNRYLTLANHYAEQYRKQKMIVKKGYRPEPTLIYRKRRYPYLPQEILDKYGIDDW
jgi:hypothetical protein